MNNQIFNIVVNAFSQAIIEKMKNEYFTHNCVLLYDDFNITNPLQLTKYQIFGDKMTITIHDIIDKMSNEDIHVMNDYIHNQFSAINMNYDTYKPRIIDWLKYASANNVNSVASLWHYQLINGVVYKVQKEYCEFNNCFIDTNKLTSTDSCDVYFNYRKFYIFDEKELVLPTIDKIIEVLVKNAFSPLDKTIVADDDNISNYDYDAPVYKTVIPLADLWELLAGNISRYDSITQGEVSDMLKQAWLEGHNNIDIMQAIAKEYNINVIKMKYVFADKTEELIDNIVFYWSDNTTEEKEKDWISKDVLNHIIAQIFVDKYAKDSFTADNMSVMTSEIMERIHKLYDELMEMYPYKKSCTEMPDEKYIHDLMIDMYYPENVEDDETNALVEEVNKLVDNKNFLTIDDVSLSWPGASHINVYFTINRVKDNTKNENENTEEKTTSIADVVKNMYYDVNSKEKPIDMAQRVQDAMVEAIVDKLNKEISNKTLDFDVNDTIVKVKISVSSEDVYVKYKEMFNSTYYDDEEQNVFVCINDWVEYIHQTYDDYKQVINALHKKTGFDFIHLNLSVDNASIRNEIVWQLNTYFGFDKTHN